jgi:hypothetical protein
MPIKLLITGGCSFAMPDNNSPIKWPVQLADKLNVPVINTAHRSQGNGLISRKIIYQVSETLKTVDASEILVGIMWSGPDRQDFYINNKETRNHPDYLYTSLSPTTDKNWLILNAHWENHYAKSYYSTFHNDIGALIYTYEHILRVQWFLKLHNISYFMTTYMDTVFYNHHRFYQNKILRHAESAHLYNQIDHDQFLSVNGQYEWAVDTGLSFFPYGKSIDDHPTTEHNQKFVDEIIIPFLSKKNYI